MNDETSTLSRWSKLKHQAEAEKQSAKNLVQEVDLDAEVAPDLGVQLDAASEIADLPEVVSDPQSTTGIEATEEAVEEEPLLSDEDMPEVQTLTSQSDISMFFNRGVSKTVRNAALKYLFQLPQYNIRDGLNDYDEDYTYFEPLGDTITCDMKFHKERKEREAREAEEREALLAEQEETERAEQEASEDANEKNANNESTEDEALDAEATEETAQGDNVGQEVGIEPDQEQDPPDTQDDIQDGDAMHADSPSVTDPSKLTDHTAQV